MGARDRRVDAYLGKVKAWRAELAGLRALLLESELDETLKWRQPCYVLGGRNVAVLGGFRDYCALAFFKGVLLNDPGGLLTAPGANSQTVRQVRVTGAAEVERLAEPIRRFIAAAVAAEKAGRKVAMRAAAELVPVAELAERLAADPGLAAAFDALTPGRRRGWNLHFGGAKKPETRAARVEKARAAILAGKGWNER